MCPSRIEYDEKENTFNVVRTLVSKHENMTEALGAIERYNKALDKIAMLIPEKSDKDALLIDCILKLFLSFDVV